MSAAKKILIYASLFVVALMAAFFAAMMCMFECNAYGSLIGWIFIIMGTIINPMIFVAVAIIFLATTEFKERRTLFGRYFGLYVVSHALLATYLYLFP